MSVKPLHQPLRLYRLPSNNLERGRDKQDPNRIHAAKGLLPVQLKPDTASVSLVE
jgi:hypothetical protein